MSRARMNFNEEVEAALNDQVMAELTAYYKYQAMASWLARDDISLPGLASYYYQTAVGEQGHAKKVTDYISTRGGRVVYREIPAMKVKHHLGFKAVLKHLLRLNGNLL